MVVAEGLLDGGGALLVIAATIGFGLVCVLAWDARAVILSPLGLVVLPLAVGLWFVGAMVIGLPANVLLGHSDAGQMWPGLVAAPLVAVILGRRFRTRGGNTPGRVLVRAGVLLAGCTLAKCVAFWLGFPVFDFWVGGAVTLGAMVVCAVVWQFADFDGRWHLFVRAGVILVAVGAVGAWANANQVPVAGNPRTASATTVSIMLLVFPLFVLVALLLVIGVIRWLPPGLRVGLRIAGGGDRTDRLPAAREVWNAFVTFDEDDGEGKDRPVLVLGADRQGADVLKITSQDKSRFDDYLALPLARSQGVLSKDSWLELRPTRVPLELFRSYRGPCPQWVWSEVGARGLAGSAPAVGSGPRSLFHRFFSAGRPPRGISD